MSLAASNKLGVLAMVALTDHVQMHPVRCGVRLNRHAYIPCCALASTTSPHAAQFVLHSLADDHGHVTKAMPILCSTAGTAGTALLQGLSGLC